MILGPFLGSAVIRGSAATYEALGEVKSVPTPGIFLAAAIVLLLVIVPVTALRRQDGAQAGTAEK